jgi:hypothetical protein
VKFCIAGNKTLNFTFLLFFYIFTYKELSDCASHIDVGFTSLISVGGVAVHTTELAAAWKEKSHEVHVLPACVGRETGIRLNSRSPLHRDLTEEQMIISMI